MTAKLHPGQDAWAEHGFWATHRWLVARRLAQLGFLLLFASGPWLGVWIAKGTLASSLTLGVLPLTDPLILLQSLVARHAPETSALIGAAIVLATYLLLGGRLYCSWVCPINPVTDLALWTRRRLGIDKGVTLKRSTRYVVLAGVILASAVTGTIAFELVNPITGFYRLVLFGASAGLAAIVLIFLFDVVVAKNGWCGHICPVGAFYGLLNHRALLRVSAAGREHCDDCMDCYAVCPEMHVISPALKGAKAGAGPIIAAADCTACARCIDVCPERVFRFTHRFDQRLDPAPAARQTEKAAA